MSIRAKQSVTRLATTTTFVVVAAVGASLLTLAIISLLEMKYLVALIGVFGLIVGAFVVRDRRLYGLMLFFFFLMTEGDIGLTLVRVFTDWDAEIFAIHGRPPITTLNLKIHPSDLILMALMFPWALRWLSNWRAIPFSWIGMLPLGYLMWTGFSLLVASAHPFLGFAHLFEQLKYFLMFLYVLDEFASKRRLRTVLLVLMSALAFQSVMAVISVRYQGVWDMLSIVQSNVHTANVVGTEQEATLYASLHASPDEGGGWRRAIGTMHGYATLGMFLNILLPFAVVRFLASLSARVSWGYGTLALLGMLAVAASVGRTAYVALASQLAFCVYYASRTALISKRTFMIALALGAMLTAASINLIVDQYLLREATVEARLPLMEKALIMVAERPLLGVGLNNHTSYKMSAFEAPAAEEEVSTHNYYLVIATEVGVPGLVLYMAFFFAVWRRGFRLLRSNQRETVIYALALLGAFVSVAVQMLADPMLNYVPYAMLWFYAGLVVALHRVETARDQR